MLKKRDTEQERLVAQLDGQERIIRDAFLAFVRTVKSDEVLREVNAFLAVGDIEGALAIVDTHIIRLSNILPKVIRDVGDTEANVLLSTLGVSSVGIAFDPTDTRAANMIRQNRLEFIAQTTEAQREATRQALTRAFEVGEGPRQTAIAFRDSLGLTGKQEKAVENYRSLLRGNSAQALERQLRDRRFDRSVQGAISRGEPLGEQQIDRMVTRYRERFVQFRAETVARTEGLRATSMARDEALRQTVEDTGTDETRVERTWKRTNDDRTRDHHDVMQNQKVGLNQSFIDGNGNSLRFPGDPSAPLDTTAQCRCLVTIRFKKKKP